MVCRYVRFGPVGPEAEWVPMGLRDGVCALRSKRPARRVERTAEEPAAAGGEVLCDHCQDGSWGECPFCVEHGSRKATDRDEDRPRNEFGYPLILD